MFGTRIKIGPKSTSLLESIINTLKYRGVPIKFFDSILRLGKSRRRSMISTWGGGGE